MLISTLFCQLHIGNNLSAKHRDILTELYAVTELLGDFIFLFSFSALQVQESELFPVIQSMSGIGGLKSSVSLPYQTHKNQNSNPRHTCSLFFRALSGKSGLWETHYLMTGRSWRWMLQGGIIWMGYFLPAGLLLTLRSTHFWTFFLQIHFSCWRMLKKKANSFTLALFLSPSFNSFFPLDI